MKYKVGDKVRIKDIDWYNKNKSKSHGTVACGGKYFDYDMKEWCGKTMTILEVYQTCYIMREDGAKDLWTDEMIEGLVEEEIIDLTSIVMETVEEKTIQNALTYGYTLPEGYQFVDEDGSVINTNKIVLKKKNEYPKTYEECCELLDGCSYNVLLDRCETSYEEFLHNKLLALRKLLICRDAYWKLYGEEMGLGKPWEPDWNTSEPKYVISCTSNGIEKQWETTYCKVLAFPTAEMRDAFYEVFREEIEICKELL